MSDLVMKRHPLHKGMHGPDVRVLQRALRKANCREKVPTGEFRELTRKQVVRFQRHHGIRKDRGIVRLNTWHALQPYFDGYDHWLMNHYHPQAVTLNPLDKFIKVAWWYYAQRPLDYYQQRPMYDTDPPPNVDDHMDCSEFVYVCAKAAGLPDPSGAGYTGWGNTYSFIAHLPHASIPQKGDLVFYDLPSHVGICTGFSALYKTLMVLSHGGDGGPRFLPYRYRTPVAYRTWRGLL